MKAAARTAVETATEDFRKTEIVEAAAASASRPRPTTMRPTHRKPMKRADRGAVADHRFEGGPATPAADQGVTKTRPATSWTAVLQGAK